MSYAHIENLYRPEAQKILAFKQVYALEKIHGTSAHISYGDHSVSRSLGGNVAFFSGGESYERFKALFNESELLAKFLEVFPDVSKVMVFGEAYGGKCQGMSETYGKDLKFIAFDVLVGDEEAGAWLSVPDAAEVVSKLGLEFVHYDLTLTDLPVLDALRDADSVQAVRNGCGPGHVREGIVLRPPFEVRTARGRICAKHKGEKFNERKSTPKVDDPVKRALIEKAEEVANEFVVPERLNHVLDHLKAALCRDLQVSDTGAVVRAMVEDVMREASGEIVDSREVRSAVGSKAAQMFKRMVTTV